MKMTVKQHRDFFALLEPYFDGDLLHTSDELYKINGVVDDEFDPDDHPDNQIIELAGGYFCSLCDSTKHLDGKSIASLFRKWLKQQGLKQYVVTVPTSKAAEFEAACALIEGVKLK